MNKLKNITLPELTQVSLWKRILRFFNIIESEYTSNNYGNYVVAINVKKNKWMLYDKSSNRFYDIISAVRFGNIHLWNINEIPGNNYINDCIGSRKDVHNAVIRLTNKKDIVYDIQNAINNIKIMSNSSPSKIRSKKSLELATKLVYANKGKPYEDSFNPYPENTLDNARFKRFYEKKCNFYHYMEGVFEHMAQAYGEFRPDKLTK